MQRFKISDMIEKDYYNRILEADSNYIQKLINLLNRDVDDESGVEKWKRDVVCLVHDVNIDTKPKLKELIIKLGRYMQDKFVTSDGRVVTSDQVIKIKRFEQVNLVDKLVLKVTAPGLTKEDVKVSVKGNELEGLQLIVTSNKEADMGFGLIVGVMELATKGFNLQGIYVEVVNGIIFVNIPKVGVVDIEVPMVAALEGKKELKPKSK